mmetsp:Transcript_18231/g.35815  ORF Transcript_18231/g.35815 Transcript_18231/m.35815 type:complete len:365 (-) Transcript_18231:221-1315(-)
MLSSTAKLLRQAQNLSIRTNSVLSTRTMASSIPATQKAIVLDSVVADPSGLDACFRTDYEVPKPGPKQVLVHNKFAGVNFIDTYHRTGLYKLPTPFGLGREGSGEVVAVGNDVDASICKVGDRVAYLGPDTYQEYTACSSNFVYSVPEGVELDVLTTLLTQGLTAQYLACNTFQLGPGKVCLVQAAAGGTGQLLVQMAKALGATVIGTCSKSKVPVAESVGCDLVLPYDELSEEEVVKRVKEATEGKGVHVSYDGVGAKTYKMSMNCVRKLGTVVLFGNASGAVPPIDPLQLSALGSIFLTRPKLYDYLDDHEDFKKRMDQLVAWIKDGSVKVTVQQVLPLEQAGEAHRLLESGATKGKLLLSM